MRSNACRRTNKPLPGEMRNCNDYLTADLALLPAGGAVLALGRIAHDATLLALGLRRNHFAFAHGARHALPHGARALRQLPLQPLQHEYRPPHAGDVPHGVRRDRRCISVAPAP